MILEEQLKFPRKIDGKVFNRTVIKEFIISWGDTVLVVNSLMEP